FQLIHFRLHPLGFGVQADEVVADLLFLLGIALGFGNGKKLFNVGGQLGSVSLVLIGHVALPGGQTDVLACNSLFQFGGDLFLASSKFVATNNNAFFERQFGFGTAKFKGGRAFGALIGFFGRVVEEGKEAVVVALRERIVFVVVALAAFERRAKP